MRIIYNHSAARDDIAHDGHLGHIAEIGEYIEFTRKVVVHAALELVAGDCISLDVNFIAVRILEEMIMVLVLDSGPASRAVTGKCAALVFGLAIGAKPVDIVGIPITFFVTKIFLVGCLKLVDGGINVIGSAQQIPDFPKVVDFRLSHINTGSQLQVLSGLVVELRQRTHRPLVVDAVVQDTFGFSGSLVLRYGGIPVVAPWKRKGSAGHVIGIELFDACANKCSAAGAP